MKKKYLYVTFIVTVSVCWALLRYADYDNSKRDDWQARYDKKISKMIEAGKYEEAINLGETALTAAQEKFGSDDYFCAVANERLARANLSLERKRKALLHLAKASEIYSKYSGLCINNIELYEKMGDIRCDLGEQAEGLELYNNALKMMNDWGTDRERKEALLEKIEKMSS